MFKGWSWAGVVTEVERLPAVCDLTPQHCGPTGWLRPVIVFLYVFMCMFFSLSH